MEQKSLDSKKVMEKLENMQKDLDYLKEHVEDLTLDEDDLNSIKEGKKEKEAGETTSLEDLKKN